MPACSCSRVVSVHEFLQTQVACRSGSLILSPALSVRTLKASALLLIWDKTLPLTKQSDPFNVNLCDTVLFAVSWIWKCNRNFATRRLFQKKIDPTVNLFTRQVTCLWIKNNILKLLTTWCKKQISTCLQIVMHFSRHFLEAKTEECFKSCPLSLVFNSLMHLREAFPTEDSVEFSHIVQTCVHTTESFVGGKHMHLTRFGSWDEVPFGHHDDLSICSKSRLWDACKAQEQGVAVPKRTAKLHSFLVFWCLRAPYLQIIHQVLRANFRRRGLGLRKYCKLMKVFCL